MSFFCYLLECADGTFYTGWTTDPPRREKQHNAGRGAKYTRARRPVKLVYVEELPSRAEAMKRELAIKAMTREGKKRMVESRRTFESPAVPHPADVNTWASSALEEAEAIAI